MKFSLRPVVPVLAAAALLLVGTSTVAEASGHSLLTGHHNTAKKSTWLRNKGHGPALSLRTRSTAPPLAVSSQVRVPRLNADLVDGLHADALQTSAYTYRLEFPGAVSTARLVFPALPAGNYLVNGSLRLIALSSAGASVQCGFAHEPGAPISPVASSTSYPTGLTVNIAGAIDSRTVRNFVCTASAGSFRFAPESAITFTQVDHLLTRPAALAANLAG